MEAENWSLPNTERVRGVHVPPDKVRPLKPVPPRLKTQPATAGFMARPNRKGPNQDMTPHNRNHTINLKHSSKRDLSWDSLEYQTLKCQGFTSNENTRPVTLINDQKQHLVKKQRSEWPGILTKPRAGTVLASFGLYFDNWIGF